MWSLAENPRFLPTTRYLTAAGLALTYGLSGRVAHERQGGAVMSQTQ
jgi:hypothetical protein